MKMHGTFSRMEKGVLLRTTDMPKGTDWLAVSVGHVDCVPDNLRMGPINLRGQSDLNCSNTVTLISCPEIQC